MASLLDKVKVLLGSVAPAEGPVVEQPMSARSLGARLRSWRPELPDPRDHYYAPRKAMAARPQVVKPLGSHTRIHDQGYTSSCTGHAATAVLETRLGLVGDDAQLSRLFPYYLARELIDETELDAGAYNRDVIKCMLKAGVPRETYWRFSKQNLARKPSPRAYHEAELMRQSIEDKKFVYERIVSFDAMLDAISGKNPVLFGFLAYENIFGLTADKPVYAMPTPDMRPLGGHAVMADGYDMEERIVWVQNSWGTSWGRRGYFKMPFEWWTNPGQLVDDMWTIRPDDGVVITPGQS